MGCKWAREQRDHASFLNRSVVHAFTSAPSSLARSRQTNRSQASCLTKQFTGLACSAYPQECLVLHRKNGVYFSGSGIELPVLWACASTPATIASTALDVPPEARPPHVQHIVLLNRDEIDRALVNRNET